MHTHDVHKLYIHMYSISYIIANASNLINAYIIPREHFIVFSASLLVANSIDNPLDILTDIKRGGGGGGGGFKTLTGS